MEITVAHTGQLDPAMLAAVRSLLDEAFGGDFADADWEHTLGGMHALAHEGDCLVGHGAVVERRLLHGERALRAGYVEGVAVAAGHRRRGVASAVMDQLERVIRDGYDLGALSASDAGAELYLHRGWQRWRGTAWALAPDGRVRTEEEDDALFVLPGAAGLDLEGELTCDWRDGDLW